jgi:hypothetical protein
MVVLGHVQHLIGVDNVEVGHEQHLGEEGGVVAGLLVLVDHAGGVQDFLVQGEDQRVVAGFCLQLQHQEERTQPPGVKVSFADRDINTQGVENIVEYLGIQRQGNILRLYFLLNIMFHGPKSNPQ